MSEVAHRVDSGGPYPVVRLTGELDADAGPDARSALLAVLAGQPEALVIDVSGLHLVEPGATAALRDVARLNTAWPAAHIVLCASRDAEHWHSTGLPVWPDRAQAMAELGEPDTGNRLSLHLEPIVGAARRARQLVTEACGRWDSPELAGPGCIVVTEMVNNVVAHAHTPMTVLLAAHATTMSVAVRDHSAQMPTYLGAAPAPTSYGGRGLLLIDSVSSSFGSLELADGKVVWAVLAEEPAEPERAGGHIGSTGMANPGPG